MATPCIRESLFGHPASAKRTLSVNHLHVQEYIRFQVLITQGTLYVKGGLPDPVPDPLSPNLQTVGKPKRGICQAIELVLAAIGKPEILARGHLFAACRLLVHDKLAGRSLAPLCIEYIGKPSFADISAETRCLEELSVQDPNPEPPLNPRKTSPVKYFDPTEAQLAGLHSMQQRPSRSRRLCRSFRVARPALPFRRLAASPRPVTNGEEDAAHRHLYNTFTWMGRAAFPLLVDAVTRLRPNGAYHAAFLRGLSGVGKSHLLAALVLCLRHQGKTVVYIPDCGNLIMCPVSYLASALLCAFPGENPEATQRRDEIRTLDSLDAIKRRCAAVRNNRSTGRDEFHFRFVVDQVDELDLTRERGGWKA
ncbi:hypothetical protein DFH08DRAFT_989479 [Mycena albidolilacea]|uniref:Uncharacterized protein n=1 Tax=Mycena albidolilacea TaxID=1033008 RepID=A0AAD6Z027_9AGAR|nr:hypothetical protein DFH08DRAFT_989479 [Mycena albidolilacea]